MKRGKNVLHFTLELNEKYTSNRYDTLFTGIEPKKLRDNVDYVKEVVGKVKGKLKVKYYPPSMVNVNTLLAAVHQYGGIGFVPDLIIVDYADELRSNDKAETRYQEFHDIYRQLRGLAGEVSVPVWTASQGQRSSISEEVIQGDKIAGSYGKIMVADFVLSLSRMAKDKQSNTARIHVIKNRFGPDGMTFPAIVDVLKGNIGIFDGDSEEGMQAQEAMNGAETLVRKMLNKKYKDTQENGNSNSLG